MATTEGSYHLYFDTCMLSSEEITIFEKLLADRLKQHEEMPEIWKWVEWIRNVKAPEYESHLEGANSDDVVRDIESFLHCAAKKLPALKAHGWGEIDYVMSGDCIEFEFSLSNGQLDWEENDSCEDDEEWENYEI